MKRPKWARGLAAKVWQHLQEVQGTRRPTLTQLREDVEFQNREGITCWDCRSALKAVMIKRGEVSDVYPVG